MKKKALAEMLKEMESRLKYLVASEATNSPELCARLRSLLDMVVSVAKWLEAQPPLAASAGK